MSSRLIEAESKDPSHQWKTQLNELFRLASSEDKDWEKNVVEFLEKHGRITEFPHRHYRKHYHVHFGRIHPEPLHNDPFTDANFTPDEIKTPSCVSDLFHLWIKAVSHPRLISTMKVMIVFHSTIDEKYYPLRFHPEKTLSALVNAYNETAQRFMKEQGDSLKTHQDGIEHHLLYAAHSLMVIYRHALPLFNAEAVTQVQEKNQKLTASIIGLLAFVSTETLMARRIKIAEGSSNNETLCTLERACETYNTEITGVILSKGHVTHAGDPIHSESWDNPKNWNIFENHALRCTTLISMALCCLIVQYDTCPDLVTQLPNGLRPKVTLILAALQVAIEEATKEIDQAVGMLPLGVVRIIARYGVFNPYEKLIKKNPPAQLANAAEIQSHNSPDSISLTL